MVTRKMKSFDEMLYQASRNRSLMFSVLILGALLAFEIFNFSTTDFAMSDLLGDLRFGGFRWATILAIAFCGIDFAGIARLFTPEQGREEPAEVWYLFGAWLLGATMNAILTWWGVSIAILQHQSLGNAVISREAMLRGVPIFVAVMVWLSRVLIIGTFSVAGERLFEQAGQTARPRTFTQRQITSYRTNRQPQTTRSAPQIRPAYSSSRPSPKPRNEEVYQQVPMVAKSKDNSERRRYS